MAKVGHRDEHLPVIRAKTDDLLSFWGICEICKMNGTFLSTGEFTYARALYSVTM